MNETEMAKILFSLNKKAKNIREEQRDLVYRKTRKITKTNKGAIETQINNLRNQKFSYYKEKDELLRTYFSPICIHKTNHIVKEFEYVSNMKGVDLENLMKKNFRSYFFFNFLDEKYQKKMKTIKIDEREYKTNLFQFNEFITDKEIVTKILNEIDRTFEEVLIKGNKIYIPFFRKDEFYKKMDFIFVKHLWNGKRLIKPPKFKTIMIFGNIRIAQKTNIVSSDDKYYLFYKVDEYSFHSPIEKEELEKYKDLEIKEVIMNTKGEDTNKLMDDFEIEEKLNQLKGDI